MTSLYHINFDQSIQPMKQWSENLKTCVSKCQEQEENRDDSLRLNFKILI